MNQTRDRKEPIWQGALGVLLLVLVLFSDAIAGSEPDSGIAAAAPHCGACVSVAVAPGRP